MSEDPIKGWLHEFEEISRTGTTASTEREHRQAELARDTEKIERDAHIRADVQAQRENDWYHQNIGKINNKQYRDLILHKYGFDSGI